MKGIRYVSVWVLPVLCAGGNLRCLDPKANVLNLFLHLSHSLLEIQNEGLNAGDLGIGIIGSRNVPSLTHNPHHGGCFLWTTPVGMCILIGEGNIQAT